MKHDSHLSEVICIFLSGSDCWCSRMQSCAEISEQLFNEKDQVLRVHSAHCGKDPLRFWLSEPHAGMTTAFSTTAVTEV